MTVEAIHAATVQVLLADGISRLTTTRVAERAGVSVGTIYQYFSHKQALLFAVLERHLDCIEATMLATAERLAGSDLAAIADGLATAWLDAKTADIAASRAIYGAAAEFDIAALLARGSLRMQEAIGGLLRTAPDGRFNDVEAVAFMTLALLGGPTRVVMDMGAPTSALARLRTELPRACHAYLCAASAGSRRCSGSTT